MIRSILLAGCVALAPGLALAEAPPLEAYGRLPSLEEVSLSPSGERLAFVTVSGDKRVLMATTRTGEAIQAAAVGTIKLRDVRWAGDDHLLAMISRTATLPIEFSARKAELSTVLALNLKTKTSAPLFGRLHELSPLVFGLYGVSQRDGRWLVAAGGQKDADIGTAHPNLYTVDLDTMAVARAALGNDLSDDWVIDASGNVIATVEYDARNSHWRLHAGGAGGKEVAARTTPTKDVEVVGLGRTPGTVLIEDNTGDDDHLIEQPLAPGAAPTPLFEDIGVDRLLFDTNSHLLIGYLSDGGRTPHLFDPLSQKRVVASQKAFPGEQVSLVAYTADFTAMVLFTDGADDSGTYWLVDIAKKSAAPIGSAYPLIKSKDVGPTRMFSYQAADGLALEGVLTLPPGGADKNLPVVVMPHGGPIGVRDRVGFDWWAQAFAARGYAVFQPNFRGSGGYSAQFRHAGMGEWGRKMQTDVSDGLAALAKAGIVDSKRASIVGASYGGYAALAGVTLQHGLYRCAVSYAGVSDLAAMMDWERTREVTANDVTRYWRAALGSHAEQKAYSPIQLADKADAPVLLIHGKDDTVVPIAQSQRMAAQLRRAGKPVELLELNGEDHWLSGGDSRLAMLKAAVAFVEKNNPAH